MTALSFEPLGGPIGVRVDGLVMGEGSEPDGAVVDALRRGLSEHSVLVFRGRSISAAQFVALGRAFGELEILPEPEKRHPEHPEIFNLTNVGPDDRVVEIDDPQSVFLRGTERWHTDSSFRAVPSLCTLLYAIEVPDEGGETEFADMILAHDELPGDLLAAVAGRRLIHSYEYSRANNPGRLEPMRDEERAKFPPVSHPLVRVDASGRRSLYLGGHVAAVEGLDDPAGRALIDAVLDHATQERYVYRHRWQANDLVVWDNRSTLHRLRPYAIGRHRRVMRRITVAGTEAPQPAHPELASPG